MGQCSIRERLRGKRTGKKALSPEMRNLMVSFEAQYMRRDPQDANRSSHQKSRNR